MWLLAAASLLLAAVMASSRLRVLVLVRVLVRVRVRLQSLLRGTPSARTVHDFVFSNCKHGDVLSVLETFDLYAATRPSLSIGPHTGALLDQVVAQVLDQVVDPGRPLWALELGTHCGYSSVRLLRLLPPSGRLVTVELDPPTADLGEEVLLVSGFTHSQFQVLTCSSAEAISSMRSNLETQQDPSPGSTLETQQDPSPGFGLVLMDHDPDQYLPDLLALEGLDLLRPAGCSLLLVSRDQNPEGLQRVLDHIRGRADRYRVSRDLQGLVEVFYREGGP